jgi:hypothetical protein
MSVSIIKKNSESITLQVTIPFNRSMLNSENTIQDIMNEVGTIATGELLKTFDTEGEDILFGTIKMVSKGLVNKSYQTPYGEINIERHIYQSSLGGSTFCPLERDARIILTSTPRFASQVSHKMAGTAAAYVVNDLAVNHGRYVAKNVVQRLAEAVSAVVQIKEETWSYHVPDIKQAKVKTVSIGLDGTCMLMCEGAYRQAMVGTIALYDADGERLHTTYVAAAPEHGKEKFKERLAREIGRAKGLYPKAIKIGIADGAHDNWDFLEQHTTKQTLDFYHATEYLTDVADKVFSSSIERKAWLDDRCHQLKHTKDAAANLLTEMESFQNDQIINPSLTPPALSKNLEIEISTDLPGAPVPSMKIIEDVENKSKIENLKKNREQKKKTLEAAITYFRNNNEKHRMNYWESMAVNHPIGSGVTEAACKTIVKQRLCSSGMRWKDKGAGVILSLRALSHSTGRWEQFWQKVNQFGFPIAA